MPIEDRLFVKNPFAAKRLAPGRQTYVLPSADNWGSHVDRWRQLEGRACILGPHGVGKSTYLLSFARACWERGEDADRWHWYQVRPSGELSAMQPTLSVEANEKAWQVVRGKDCSVRSLLSTAKAQDTIVIDGFDSLGWFSRFRLNQKLRRKGCRLLATTHSRMRSLRALIELRPTLSDFARVIANWQPRVMISDSDLEAVWNQHDGNIRECLFELYDRWDAGELGEAQKSLRHNQVAAIQLWSDPAVPNVAAMTDRR